jgi:hypothetical protein
MAFMNWFRGKDDTPVVTMPQIQLSFTEKMTQELNTFVHSVKLNSSQLPPMAYSRLRHAEDAMRKLLAYIEKSKVRLIAEHSFAVEAMITDYLPNTLTTYLALDEDDRTETAQLSKTLISQCATLHLKILDIEDKIQEEAIREANAHNQFINNRLAQD